MLVEHHHYYESLGPSSLVLGPWSLVPCPWPLVLGSWSLVPDPWANIPVFVILFSYRNNLAPSKYCDTNRAAPHLREGLPLTKSTFIAFDTFEEHENDWLNSELLDAEKNIDVVASQCQELSPQYGIVRSGPNSARSNNKPVNSAT